jgi:hypothetical protein
LDDFFSIFLPGSDISGPSRQFDDILNTIGFTKASEKDQSGTIVNHLGFEFDSAKMEVHLPPNKLLRAGLQSRVSYPESLFHSHRLKKFLASSHIAAKLSHLDALSFDNYFPSAEKGMIPPSPFVLFCKVRPPLVAPVFVTLVIHISSPTLLHYLRCGNLMQVVSKVSVGLSA